MKGSAELEAAWVEEEAQRVREGVVLFCRIAFVIFLIFWALDWLIYPPEVVWRFLWLRLACAAGYPVLLFLAPRAKKRIHLTGLGSAAVWWVSFIICVMLTYTDYERSLYYAGLIVTMLAMGLVLQWRWQETLLVGIGQAVMFTIVAFRNPHPDWKAALNNVSFIFGALGIALAANVKTSRLTRRELEGRHSLAAANDQLRTLDKAKSEFMANISHEMRTPLTLMLGALESLATTHAGTLGDRQVEYLDVIRRNGLSLLRLINDLLELARLEAAQARLRIEDFDLTELVNGITIQASPMFGWRSLTLDRALPAGPVEVSLDRMKIEKVVLNLLSNAIKFTPEGGEIRVVLRERPEHVEVEIKDSGIGIPAEHHERIFERFSQVDATATRSRGGTGIGLALVKEFVELHTGTVVVASEPGVGSTFTVTLPKGAAGIPLERIDRRMARADSMDQRRQDDVGLGSWVQTISESPEYRYGELFDVADRRSSSRIEVGPRHGTVLVVEDSRDLVRFISLQLANKYNVITAGDGEEGWERARAERPDVVITDLMMPKRDGLWLCEQLKSDPITKQIPIIMLTARGAEEDRVQARTHGADIYLSKPFSVSELHAALVRLMGRKGERIDSLQTETSLSMKVLTSGLAHELMNPLGFIANSVFALDELLKEMIESGDTAVLGPTCLDLLRSANVGLDRIQALIRELKLISEPSPEVDAETADLDQALRSTAVLVGAESSTTVRFHIDLAAPEPVVCRIGRMNQVFLNLMKNALLALPAEGGEVWVVSRGKPDAVEVTISDNGCGIAPENLERVFDPFFTTRAPGVGTGLGLALCRRIVEEHGGTLSVTSVVNEGTRVTLRIPIAVSGEAARLADAGLQRDALAMS